MDPTADQLRAARSWLDWTLEVAEEKSGVHHQTISKVERGQSKGSRDTIRKLVKAYADHGIWMDENKIEYHPPENEK